jgi:hypothetical protein
MPPDRSIVDPNFPAATRPDRRLSPLVSVTFAVVRQFLYLFYGGQIKSQSWAVFCHVNLLLQQSV